MLGNLVIDRSLWRIRLNGSQHSTLILTLLSKIEAPIVRHGLTAGADNAAATCRSDRFRANRFRAQHTAQHRAADRTMGPEVTVPRREEIAPVLAPETGAENR
jgi:hypothetical protein